ncbi:MAG: hypothetical protein LBR33_00315 [Propionibacteriaceae bacterium]|jgi:membrane protein implicated in regulation of membrane protease activity|nr:hypothetical protein [Propionibacteriaceae bacterium]
MQSHLVAWLGAHPLWAWLLVALFLSTLFLVRADRRLLIVALAAVVTGVAAALIPGHGFVSLLIFAALSAGALAAARRTSRGA